MNKIIEFFNSELCFWINLSLALIGISLWFLNWVLMRKRLKRMIRESAEYFSKIVYFPMTSVDDKYVGGKSRLLTDLCLNLDKMYVEKMFKSLKIDEKNFILKTLRHGEAVERKNNLVSEENKNIVDFDCYNFGVYKFTSTPLTEEEKVIKEAFEKYVEVQRERFSCNIPGVSVQRPDSYAEDKPDEI